MDFPQLRRLLSHFGGQNFQDWDGLFLGEPGLVPIIGIIKKPTQWWVNDFLQTVNARDVGIYEYNVSCLLLIRNLQTFFQILVDALYPLKCVKARRNQQNDNGGSWYWTIKNLMNLNGQTLTATSQLKKTQWRCCDWPHGCCACYFRATRQNYTKTSSQMVQPWASLPTTTASTHNPHLWLPATH